MENACAFLNTSPSFLHENKNQTIKLSTLKNKLNEWLRSVRSDRDGYAMGQQAFYDLATHPESTKLIIDIVKMQDAALQRQDHDRVQADPARHDHHLAQAVRMPVPVAAPQSQNPPVAAPQSQNPAVYPDTVAGRMLQAQALVAAARTVSRNSSRGGRSGRARTGIVLSSH